MIQVDSYLIEQVRFLGIQIFLPKCTMRMLFNMEMICLDESFDLKSIEMKCSIPLIQCDRGTFEQMIGGLCEKVSNSASQAGIQPAMSVKEAIACVFQNE